MDKREEKNLDMQTFYPENQWNSAIWNLRLIAARNGIYGLSAPNWSSVMALSLNPMRYSSMNTQGNSCRRLVVTSSSNAAHFFLIRTTTSKRHSSIVHEPSAMLQLSLLLFSRCKDGIVHTYLQCIYNYIYIYSHGLRDRIYTINAYCKNRRQELQ